MTSQEYIDIAEEALLHTYNRYQIVLDRGEGGISASYKRRWGYWRICKALLRLCRDNIGYSAGVCGGIAYAA